MKYVRVQVQCLGPCAEEKFYNLQFSVEDTTEEKNISDALFTFAGSLQRQGLSIKVDGWICGCGEKLRGDEAVCWRCGAHAKRT